MYLKASENIKFNSAVNKFSFVGKNKKFQHYISGYLSEGPTFFNNSVCIIWVKYSFISFKSPALR